jgi:hypothetical protein
MSKCTGRRWSCQGSMHIVEHRRMPTDPPKKIGIRLFTCNDSPPVFPHFFWTSNRNRFGPSEDTGAVNLLSVLKEGWMMLSGTSTFLPSISTVFGRLAQISTRRVPTWGLPLELAVDDVEALEGPRLDGLEVQESLRQWLTVEVHGAADRNDWRPRLLFAPDQGGKSQQDGQESRRPQSSHHFDLRTMKPGPNHLSGG